MEVLFGIDYEPKVDAILDFISQLSEISNHSIYTSLSYKGIADVGVRFTIHEKPAYIQANKIINDMYNLTNRVLNVTACNSTIVPLEGDYLIRKRTGHGNQSNPTKITIGSDYLVQKFIDTSIDGKFYSGRIAVIGNEFYPMYSCSSSHWNTNVHAGYIETFRDDRECFSDLPNFTIKMYEVFRLWRLENHLELGALDFSIHNGRPMIWEAQTALAFESPFSDHIKDKINQELILRAVDRYLSWQ